jgi:GT2 family glycosyltransferase
MSAALVTLMPLNYNGLDLLKLALPKLTEAASNSTYSVSITIVDNASSDGSENWVRENYPQVDFLALKENKMLASYNEAIQACQSPYVMILNNDVLVEPDVIDPLVERLKNIESSFGVSPKIMADKASENWQDRLGGNFFHGHLAPVKLGQEPGGTLYCHGAAMLVDRERFLKLNGFDPLFFYGEDNDLSYRAWRAGLSCLFEPSVSVHHLGSQSVKKLADGLEQKRAYKERANNFFVLKNVQNGSWKMNFKYWSLLKCLKMILTCDKKRFWAYQQTWKHLKVLKHSAAVQPQVDDEVLMDQISSFTLPAR